MAWLQSRCSDLSDQCVHQIVRMAKWWRCRWHQASKRQRTPLQLCSQKRLREREEGRVPRWRGKWTRRQTLKRWLRSDNYRLRRLSKNWVDYYIWRQTWMRPYHGKQHNSKYRQPCRYCQIRKIRVTAISLWTYIDVKYAIVANVIRFRNRSL